MLVKMGRTGPLDEPRGGPRAGESGDRRSQNADSSPRAEGLLGLGFEAKLKGKCGALRVGVWGPGKPLRFEHWGAREVFPSNRSTP